MNVNQSGARNSNWKGGRIRRNGYISIKLHGHLRCNKQGYVKEHILMAERALGKPLPAGAEVHHVNGKKGDNTRGNHVLCQDHAYHALLTRRTRAYKACGNAHWIPCKYCKKHDAPEKLVISGRCAHHRSCKNENNRKVEERHRDQEETRRKGKMMNNGL